MLRISNGRRAVQFHWLAQRLAEALYREELRRGSWVSDIGLWGPGAFREEAHQILTHIRPDFGVLEMQAASLQQVENLQTQPGDFLKENGGIGR